VRLLRYSCILAVIDTLLILTVRLLENNIVGVWSFESVAIWKHNVQVLRSNFDPPPPTNLQMNAIDYIPHMDRRIIMEQMDAGIAISDTLFAFSCVIGEFGCRLTPYIRWKHSQTVSVTWNWATCFCRCTCNIGMTLHDPLIWKRPSIKICHWYSIGVELLLITAATGNAQICPRIPRSPDDDKRWYA
jgi:hypothetical protein